MSAVVAPAKPLAPGTDATRDATAPPAGVDVAVPDTPAPPSQEAEHREQLRLVLRQWLRVPGAVLLLALYIGYLGWQAVPVSWQLAWAAVCVGSLMLRAWMSARLLRDPDGLAHPAGVARRLLAIAAFNGLVAGSAAPIVMPELSPERQALLMMVMCCWGAGAIASNGAFPRAYYAFAIPFFAQVCAAWVVSGGHDQGFIVLLLSAFVAVLVAFVRDNGRMTVESIRLRSANEQLLSQKEMLIDRLRSAVDTARAAREKAEHASRAKSQFLASASHDLRQPLHALSLLTGLLHDLAQEPKVRKVSAQIERSVDSLDRLFGALLDLSKLDAGAVRPEPRDLDLADLSERLATEFRPKAAKKGLEFLCECPPVWVRADPILLERILRNLLENAVRFTFAGHVALRAAHDGRLVRLVVADTGAGIPASEHERIFDEFYQLHNPGRDRSNGMGLGLSIVRRLVDMLGWKLSLDSQPGEGSRFTLSLPDALVERGAGSGVAAPAAVPSLAGLAVLAIEDDVQVRQALELLLASRGCVPLMAGTLAEAREAVTRHGGPPDVIVSDLRLAHGEDGISVVHALRAELGPVPAAIITGDTAPERLAELGRAGLPVLHKPIQARALAQLLSELAADARIR